MTQRLEDPDVPRGSLQSRAGWLFAAVWLIYLGYPLGDLFKGHPGAGRVAFVLALVCVFCAAYVRVTMIADREMDRLPPHRLGNPVKVLMLGLMAVIATVLAFTVDDEWTALWIYVASGCGLALPLRRPASWAARCGLAACALMLMEAAILGVPLADCLELLLPCVFSCFGTIGMRGMHELVRQLRQARAEVARLAANEERLRMARDLHDLAGHSLATITLKAELARKLLHADTGRAEQQMLDVESVSRQALADIREAVSGYRRATLAVESASAATALRAAGIEPDIDHAVTARSGSLDPEAESALAWCLREAVTNVVRHSGARTCRIRLIEARMDGASSLTLQVTDDGPCAPSAAAPSAAAPPAEGNGLSGLRERLGALSEDATLMAGPLQPNGFRLTATVPARLAV